MIQLKEVKINNDNKILIPDLNIYLPFRLIANGSSGSGKSSAAYHLVNHLQKYFKKIFIICPSDDEKISLLIRDQEDFYNDPTWENLEDIIYKTKQLKEEYEEDKETYKRYKEIKKKKEMNEEDLNFLDDLSSLPPKKPDEKGYHSLLILDDVLGTPLLQKKSPLNRWYVISRHYNQSIIILNQHFFSIPKIIRGNTSLFILFNTKDKKNLQAIADEVSGMVDYQEFKKIFDYATNQPFNFLFVNLQKNEFRKNFNDVIKYK